MAQIELGRIASTSATLSESMLMCRLRAGLSRAPGSSGFALGSPKAWLGTAYHEVLEKLTAVDRETDSLEHAIERLWNAAVERQYQNAAKHPLDARFGRPETWPGYYVARAMVQLRALELVGGEPGRRPPERNGPTRTLREQQFSALGGKLVGRPDVIRGEDVLDYKSGPVLELDEASQVQVVKSAYARQLRIYGFLVHEVLGWWPKRGVLLPMAGSPAEIALDPAECSQEARNAVELLDGFNTAVSGGAAPMSLASPNPTACKWCPYKSICQGFWNSVSDKWSGQLDGACAEGVLVAAPLSLHGGAAAGLCVDVDAGTVSLRRADIAPLSTIVHPGVTSYRAGERVRVVGLRVRDDGVFLPTPRTVVARVQDLPVIAVAQQRT